MQSLEVRRAHLTRATFARLFIPELLDEAGRVIYMDCDMLVTGPLDEIWEAPLGTEHLLAAVPCPSPTSSTISRLGIRKGDYFNGGLQVFDLDTWRKNQVAEACLERLTSPDYAHLTGDEATMNDVCRGRYFKLPSGYNFYAADGTFQDALNDPQSISNIHYVKTPKPWQHPGPLSALWHFEAAKVFDLVPLKEKPLTPRQKISQWNGKRKQWMGRLAGRADYRDSAAIKAYLEGVMVPAFLASGSMAQVPPPSPPFVRPE